MGLIRAGLSAISSTMRDQWKGTSIVKVWMMMY